MKTNLIKASLLLFSTMALSQVGIGTSSPQATLDVTGNASSANIVDGVIAPRLTGDQLAAKDAVYTASQRGTLVYVTTPVTTATTKTANVTAEGYYSFNGSVWNSIAGQGGNNPGATSKIVMLQTGEVGAKPNTPLTVSTLPNAKKMYFSSQSTVTGSLLLLADPGAWNPTDQSYTVPSAGVYSVDVNYFLGGCNGTGSFYSYVYLVKSGATFGMNMKQTISPVSTIQVGDNLRSTFFAQQGDKIYIGYNYSSGNTTQYCNQIPINQSVTNNLTISRFQ